MATSNSNPNPNPMKRDREKFEACPALRDRFDAKVEEMKQRGPVGTPEITRLYGDFLPEVTRNSKPLIMELTAVAAKYKDHVEGIANAILVRIVEGAGQGTKQDYPTFSFWNNGCNQGSSVKGKYWQL